MSETFKSTHTEPVRIDEIGHSLNDRQLTETCEMIDRGYRRFAAKRGWDVGKWSKRSNARLFAKEQQ